MNGNGSTNGFTPLNTIVTSGAILCPYCNMWARTLHDYVTYPMLWCDGCGARCVLDLDSRKVAPFDLPAEIANIESKIQECKQKIEHLTLFPSVKKPKQNTTPLPQSDLQPLSEKALTCDCDSDTDSDDDDDDIDTWKYDIKKYEDSLRWMRYTLDVYNKARARQQHFFLTGEGDSSTNTTDPTGAIDIRRCQFLKVNMCYIKRIQNGVLHSVGFSNPDIDEDTKYSHIKNLLEMVKAKKRFSQISDEDLASLSFQRVNAEFNHGPSCYAYDTDQWLEEPAEKRPKNDREPPWPENAVSLACDSYDAMEPLVPYPETFNTAHDGISMFLNCVNSEGCEFLVEYWGD
jgi:hypothetical protein